MAFYANSISSWAVRASVKTVLYPKGEPPGNGGGGGVSQNYGAGVSTQGKVNPVSRRCPPKAKRKRYFLRPFTQFRRPPAAITSRSSRVTGVSQEISAPLVRLRTTKGPPAVIFDTSRESLSSRSMRS